MEIPLLSKISASEYDYMAVRSLKEAKMIVWKETVKLWKIAAPVALTSLFQFLAQSSTSMYAGHLGDLQLSSISLYSSVLGSISFSLLFGMSATLATLCGQAYGAGQHKSLGIYLQRSWVLLLITCTVLSPLYIYGASFLKLLGQEHDIAELAGQFSRQTTPGLFSYAINLPTQRFLQVQSKVNVIMIISIISLIIHNGLLYLFITVMSLGTFGAAMATNLSSWLIAGAQVVYVVGWCKESWPGLSWLAFKDLLGFTRLSLASSVMICLEQWYTPCIVLLAGHLDDPVIAVGSYSICLNFVNWQLMLLLGMNAAVSVRVSNNLGKRHARAAKYSFLVAMLYSLLCGTVFMIIVFICRDNLAILFSDSKDIQLAVADLTYILGLVMLINSSTQVMSGVAIGSGWQMMVACLNLACYYIVGLPIGILLGFNDNLGVKGLWGGTMCGNILQILLLFLIIWKTNWTKEVEQIAKRMQNSGSYSYPTIKNDAATYNSPIQILFDDPS